MAKKKKRRIKGSGDLSDRIGQVSVELLTNKILGARKVRSDGSRLTDPDGVEFDEIEHSATDGNTLYIHPRHVTVDEVSEYGRSSCNDCFGKGYRIVSLAKSGVNNPSEYIILSNRSLEGLNDEQKKMVIEEERKSSVWRVLLPCPCALRRAREKIPNFFSNRDGSIMFAVEWEEDVKETE